jgi:hypothetical protein
MGLQYSHCLSRQGWVLISMAVQEAQMSVGARTFSDEGLRQEHLPSEQELLEGMQAIQAAVAAAESEHGILASMQPVRHREDKQQLNSGAPQAH